MNFLPVLSNPSCHISFVPFWHFLGVLLYPHFLPSQNLCRFIFDPLPYFARTEPLECDTFTYIRHCFIWRCLLCGSDLRRLQCPRVSMFKSAAPGRCRIAAATEAVALFRERQQRKQLILASQSAIVLSGDATDVVSKCRCRALPKGTPYDGNEKLAEFPS